MRYIEKNEFSLDQFCTSCVVRKPLRSKHCSECDHCVSKFDHHCPWVDNCIGQYNLKYFIGFVVFTPICLMFFMHGSITCNFYNFNFFQFSLNIFIIIQRFHNLWY